ncbi:MAG: hypothetical protein ACREOY_14110 [Candidatus Dormibacteraceae bacterium]
MPEPDLTDISRADVVEQQEHALIAYWVRVISTWTETTERGGGLLDEIMAMDERRGDVSVA